MDIEDIKRLVEDQTQETLYLELKHGNALSKNDKNRSELIKDVTAIANADGGRIIYGIAEEKNRTTGVSSAASIAPVTDAEIDKEWISQIIIDNTGPRFHAFDILEVETHPGRIIIINIQKANTAHQSLLDHRYYQRGGTVIKPMQDFQIRDLMARGKSPIGELKSSFAREMQASDLHRYELQVAIVNTGDVTMEKWWLEISLPEKILRDTSVPNHSRMKNHPRYFDFFRTTKDQNNNKIIQFTCGDPFVHGERLIIHPNQEVSLKNNIINTPPIIIEVNTETYYALKDKPSIDWTLYLYNTNPIKGTIPFETWCNF
ncbi:AlbA family DNA-binding domain-containing protein [Pseudomonas nitroreducens]|uniref:AlbA family DNA-binding domain-containing protein n=1 Tax=Pseudomonas nitroreducens TaxID=46680 RepID=UPI00265AB329|nr:ATP-binding protein [Pseudomonas nitroreducens]MCP1647177.1 hypothetical protein [Pseudomonas nitroreducens]MCP1685753.1 hypothetical protein [Pseudomonas nitroreducens]